MNRFDSSIDDLKATVDGDAVPFPHAREGFLVKAILTSHPTLTPLSTYVSAIR